MTAIAAFGTAVFFCAAVHAQDNPSPQITAAKAVELAREYVVGADTVAAKTIKMGEPKLAPLPRDTNAPLDSLLFPDLLLDRPAWAVALVGYRPVFWENSDSERPLPDKGTAYIDAETGLLLKIMMFDQDRYELSADTTAYGVSCLFGSFKAVKWSSAEASTLSLESVLSRGDAWIPYGASVLTAYYVTTVLPEGYERASDVPLPGEPNWLIGIKWRADVAPATIGALRSGLRPGWTFYFLGQRMATNGPQILQWDVLDSPR